MKIATISTSEAGGMNRFNPQMFGKLAELTFIAWHKTCTSHVDHIHFATTVWLGPVYIELMR